jgi:hypothetical protein
MDDETLAALKGSIAKWEAIVDGTGVDDGPDNCPLCEIFYAKECIGCPVALKSGYPGCSNTPYEDQWGQVFSDCFTNIYRANTPERKVAAQAELHFLISLLPPGETP